jgi:C1A family cysteine protease
MNFVILFLLSLSNFSQAAQGRGGLIPITPSELQKSKKIVKVRPNHIGLERVNDELRKKGKPQLAVPESLNPSNEFDLANWSSKSISQSQNVLPSQVDNSLLQSFPPIGNQGAQNSCVAWAVNYYQYSYEYRMSRNSSASAQFLTFSPKWSYNMVNGGIDSGTTITAVDSVLSRDGAVTSTAFPYGGTDYRSWDLHSNDWLQALPLRSHPMVTVTDLNTDKGISNAKQLISNGHVLTFGTYISSWSIAHVGQAAGVNNSVAGQQIAIMEAGTVNSHAMTIVGYDDTVWVDLNGNGNVDAGEMGAFKIANSWGPNYGNSGFIWVSYDALKDVSAVQGGPSSPTRRALIQQSTAYVMTVPASYSPRLLAEMTLSTDKRNDIEVYFGSSDDSHNDAQVLFWPGALVARGGPYAFDGGTTAVTGTFYFDLTDLLLAHPEYQKFYVKIMDMNTGHPVVMSDLRLLDMSRKTAILYRGTLPLSIDHTTFTAIFDHYQYELPPALTCPSISRAWGSIMDGTCSALLPEGKDHQTMIAKDTIPPHVGQAQFTCSNGVWSIAQNAICN